MKLNGVVVTNNDSDLRSCFEMLVDSSCCWADVCKKLNGEWTSAVLRHNSDIENEIHEEDFAWLVCRGKYPFEIPTSFSTYNGQTIVMSVIVLREDGVITKVHDIPCVSVEFFKM